MFRTDQSKLSPTGVPLPDAFFAVALDLTDEGGAPRPLLPSFPVDGKEDQPLSDFLDRVSKPSEADIQPSKLLPQVRVESLDPLAQVVRPEPLVKTPKKPLSVIVNKTLKLFMEEIFRLQIRVTSRNVPPNALYDRVDITWSNLDL